MKNAFPWLGVMAATALVSLPQNAQCDPKEILGLAMQSSRLFGRGERTEALAKIKEAITLTEASREGLPSNAPAQFHELAATILLTQREYADAIAYSTKSLELSTQTQDPVVLAKIRSTHGSILHQLNRDAEAEAFLREAARICETQAAFELRNIAVGTYLSLGAVLLDQGEYLAAELILHRALEAARFCMPPHQARFESQALGTLGSFYTSLGEFDRAYQYQRMSTRSGGLFSVDRLTALARTCIRMKRYDEAKETLATAREILEAGGENMSATDYALVAGMEVNLKSALGEFIEAFRTAKESHELQMKEYRGRYPMKGTDLNNMAYLALYADQHDIAESLLRQAYTETKTAAGPGSMKMAQVLGNLALLESLRNNPDKAQQFLSQSNQIYEHLLQQIAYLGSDSQKLSFLHSISGKTQFSLSLGFDQFPEHRGLQRDALLTVLQRKGRAADLSSRNADGANWAEPDLAQVERRNVLLGNISRAAIAERRSEEQIQQVAAWQLQLESIERDLRKRYPDAFAKTEVTLETVAAAIPAEHVMVEYVIYRPFRKDIPKSKEDEIPLKCAAFLLFPDGQIASVQLGDHGAIHQAAQEFRQSLASPGDQRFEEIGRRLHQMVVAPIEAKANGLTRWIVCPDGVLNLVPFSALKDASGKFLLQTHQISYLSSGRDLLHPGTPTHPESHPAIFAGPDYGPAASFQFSPLPGTLTEAESLRNLMPTSRVFTETAATEGTLKATQNPNILHIATHGFYLSSTPQFQGAQFSGEDGDRGLKRKKTPPPSQTATSAPGFFVMQSPLLRTGLALAGANQLAGGANEDGILTGLELTGLELRGTKLAVLSACETGVGDVITGEGVFGLRRGLFLAGAETQVLSLWKVHDDATQRLMTSFYRQLKDGQPIAASLRNARLELLKGDTYPHPAYWAAFILSGRSGTL